MAPTTAAVAAATELSKAAKASWPEPKPRWSKSKAHKLLVLHLDTIQGRMPRVAKDESGKLTGKLKEIHASRDKFKAHHHPKFSSRLGSLRKQVKEKETRKQLDQDAHNNYCANHPVSLFSAKGYIQWQGLDAQALALEHIEQKKHCSTKWSLWHGEHPEHCKNFPKSIS